jgi:hypothetical protein
VSEQHDDHIWLSVRGEGWAIRAIEREHEAMIFHLWRGYEPDLEFATVEFTETNWPAYCEAAAALLSRNVT